MGEDREAAYSGKPVGFQFHMLDALAQHDDTPGVAFLAGRREIEQETAPHADLSLVVAFEPETTEEYRIIQQHHVHAFAVAMCRLEHEILDGFGTPPIPDSESGHEQPEQGSKSHGFSDLPRLVRGLIASLPYCVGSGNRLPLSDTGAGNSRSTSICRKWLVSSWA